MATIRERANAKINLYLDVLKKREDGFHDVKTVMHSVTFGDDVTVSVEPSEITEVRMSIKGNKFLPTDARNLAVRAAHLFLERASITAKVTIELTKRIPVAAGLAGGSTDAAAVLRALNKIYGRLFAVSALSEIAAELGSDVVYCLFGKTALCEGKGEKITRIKCKIGYFFVIAIANEHVSTPAAYKALDALYSDFDGSVKTNGEDHYSRLCSTIRTPFFDTDGLFNVFESAVLPTCPGAARIKERLLALGAKAALMSGSGPSVFGVFESFDEARAACYRLRDEHFKAFYARSV